MIDLISLVSPSFHKMGIYSWIHNSYEEKEKVLLKKKKNQIWL